MLSVRIDDAIRSDDPHTVCHLYTADEEKELHDPKEWAKANPALGTFRSRIELEQAAEKAARMPSFENSFRNLYLNQRVNMVSAFVSGRVEGRQRCARRV
jgi:phage terminase large subunit-like protein